MAVIGIHSVSLAWWMIKIWLCEFVVCSSGHNWALQSCLIMTSMNFTCVGFAVEAAHRTADVLGFLIIHRMRKISVVFTRKRLCTREWYHFQVCPLSVLYGCGNTAHTKVCNSFHNNTYHFFREGRSE